MDYGNYQWKRIIDVVSFRIRDITAAQSSYFLESTSMFHKALEKFTS